MHDGLQFHKLLRAVAENKQAGRLLPGSQSLSDLSYMMTCSLTCSCRLWAACAGLLLACRLMLISPCDLPLLLQAVAENKQAGSPPVAHNPPMDIYQRLASELDTEGRYLFLNALANQLRYPNNHTHHFSCVLLYLFEKAQQVRIPVSGLYSYGCT